MLVQTWGRLFRGKQGLGYVCDTYMILQHEGYQFPPLDNVGAALVETQAVRWKFKLAYGGSWSWWDGGDFTNNLL